MKKYLFIGIIAILSLSLFIANQVGANPLSFGNMKETSSATTSPVYLTPNTGASAAGYVATSSLVFDTLNTSSGIRVVPESMSMGIQFKASSTLTQLKWRYEYSTGFPGGNDCVVTPLACDWYSESVDLGGVATSSVEVRTFKEYTWLYSSSTPGGITDPQDVALKIVEVPVKARYVRTTFYLNTGSSTLWTQIIPQKENN